MKISCFVLRLFVYILIILISQTNKSYAEIIQLNDETIESTNTVSATGAEVIMTLTKSFLNDDISYNLSVTIRDERDFWLFDSSKKPTAILDINGNTEIYDLKIKDPVNWVEDNGIFNSKADIDFTSNIIESILSAKGIIFSFDLFSNIHARRFFLKPKINKEMIDEWHYLFKEIKPITLDKVVKLKKTNQLKTKPKAAKGIILTALTRDRISKVHAVGSIVTLKYDGSVNIYKESDLSKIAFKVPIGTKAEIIDSIISTGKNAKPNLFKVEMHHKERKYTGWVTAYVVYE